MNKFWGINLHTYHVRSFEIITLKFQGLNRSRAKMFNSSFCMISSFLNSPTGVEGWLVQSLNFMTAVIYVEEQKLSFQSGHKILAFDFHSISEASSLRANVEKMHMNLVL